MSVEVEQVPHMHQRLERWVRWALTGRRVSGLGYAQVQLLRLGSGVAPDPAYEHECSDTDTAITLLPDELRCATMAYYLGLGTTKQRARDCGVSERTFFQRVYRAQHALCCLVAEVAARRRYWPKKSVFNKTLAKG